MRLRSNRYNYLSSDPVLNLEYKATDVREKEAWDLLEAKRMQGISVPFDDHPILNIYRPTRKGQPV